MITRWQRRRAERALADALPEAARAIARGVAAGLPVADALDRGADALDGPAVNLLRTCAAALQSGHAPQSALAPIAAIPGGVVLVGAIELHQDLGGDLVASLYAIAEGLADRERMRLEASAATAQARLAARVIPLAPIVSIGFLALLARPALAALFTTPPGLALLGVAAGLTGLALLLLRRIAHGVGL